MKHPEMPQALARLAAENCQLSKAVATKWVRRMAEANSRTDRLALQERRVELEHISIFMQAQLARMEKEKLSPEERSRMLDVCNMLTMRGSLLGLGLMVDSMTWVEKCQIKQPDGTLEPGKRRFSVAELMIDLHDMVIDSLKLQDMGTEILHDMARAQEVWRDEHGVSASPYDARKIDQIREMEEEQKAAQAPVVDAADGEAVPEKTEAAAPVANEALKEAEQFIRGAES